MDCLDARKGLKKVTIHEPGIVNVFVQFYRALSQLDREHATGLLNRERRRRGYRPILNIPQQADHVSIYNQKVKTGTVLGKLKFKKKLDAKTGKDASPGCLKREENTPLQDAFLVPTSELSKTQGLCKIEPDSSTHPLPSTSQNTIYNSQRGLETHLAPKKQRSHSIGAAAKKTPRPKDANVELRPVPNNVRQSKQDETITIPRRRPASSSEDRQHKRQKVPVDQEGSVPTTIHPNSVKSRPPKKSEQENPTVQLAKRERDRPPKSKVLSSTQAWPDVGMVVSFSRQKVEIKQEASISAFIPLPPAQPHDLQELSRHGCIPQPMLDRNMKGLMNGNVWLAQDHGLTKEDLTLNCVVSAATQRDQLTDVFPTHKSPLDIQPPIWAQVCDNTSRYKKLSLAHISIQSRQEVCETFDWFRSYQGGVYFAHNTVKGYLLSAFSSKYVVIVAYFESRDLWLNPQKRQV